MTASIASTVGRRCARARSRAAALAAAVAFASPAAASAYNWAGGVSNKWSDGGNWAGGVAPVSGADVIVNVLPAAGVSTVEDIADPFTLNQLYYRGGGASSAVPGLSGGTLVFVSNGTTTARFGALANGTTGAFATLNLNDNIVLAGTTTFVSDVYRGVPDASGASGPVNLNGVISGTGTLVNWGYAGFVNAANTYTGGTRVANSLWVGNAGNLGSGTVKISNTIYGSDAVLTLHSASNIASGDASVLVNRGGFLRYDVLDQAAINRVDPRSPGILAISPTSVVSASLDLSAAPSVRIGLSLFGATATSTTAVTFGANVTPANGTYRFGGQHGGNYVTGIAPRLVVASLLTDGPGGTPRSLNVGSSGALGGGKVTVTNTANSFSGGTLIERPDFFGGNAPILSFNYTPTTGQTPLGTGAITVQGTLRFDDAGGFGSMTNAVTFQPGSRLELDNVRYLTAATYAANNLDRWPDAKPIAMNGTTLEIDTYGSGGETVGAMTFEGGSQIKYVDRAFTAGTVTVSIGSLARVNRGTLVITPSTIDFSTRSRLVAGDNAATLVDPTTGVLSPSVIFDNAADPRFCSISNGLIQATTYRVGFDPSSDVEIARINSTTTLANDEACWGLRIESPLTISAGKTLTVRSGGMTASTIGNYAVSGPGRLAFANGGTPVEALVYVANAQPLTLAANVTAASLTKFGVGTLYLSGSNTIGGPVTVNEGTLTLRSAAALPADTPVRVEWGGTLNLEGGNVTVSSLSGDGVVTPGTTSATLTVNNIADVTFNGQLRDNTQFSRVLSLTKTGPGTLTLTGLNDLRDESTSVPQFPHRIGGYAGLTSVQQGTLVCAETSLRYGDYATSPGANLTFAADHAVGAITGSGTMQVSASINVSATSVAQGKLAIGAGAVLSVNPAGTSFMNTAAALSIAPGGRLDLANHNLLTGAGPDAVRQMLANGYRGGAWNGTATAGGVGAITSVTASLASPSDARSLAYVTSADVAAGLVSPLVGSQVGAGQTLVTLAIPADFNLDGKADFNDFLALQNHYNQSGDWARGDANFDGFVDFNDFLVLQNNYNHALPSAGPVASFGAIPEPATLSILCLPAVYALMARRRRR